VNAEDHFLLQPRCAATMRHTVLALVAVLLILQATSPGTTVVPMPNGPAEADEPFATEWLAYA
jgi:hypothetical protein